jgi:hypothetical protein
MIASKRKEEDLALSKIIATFAEQKDILLPANAQAGL